MGSLFHKLETERAVILHSRQTWDRAQGMVLFHWEDIHGTVRKISCRSSGGIRRIADRTPLWASTNWCIWSSRYFVILSGPHSCTRWRDWASTADITLRMSIASESEGGMFERRRWGKGASGSLVFEMPGRDSTLSLAARDIAFFVFRALFFTVIAVCFRFVAPLDTAFFAALLILSHCN